MNEGFWNAIACSARVNCRLVAPSRLGDESRLAPSHGTCKPSTIFCSNSVGPFRNNAGVLNARWVLFQASRTDSPTDSPAMQKGGPRGLKLARIQPIWLDAIPTMAVCCFADRRTARRRLAQPGCRAVFDVAPLQPHRLSGLNLQIPFLCAAVSARQGGVVCHDTPGPASNPPLLPRVCPPNATLMHTLCQPAYTPSHEI
ncbi:hypothetical protein B0T26DRAFT_367712 [Lasiosphaeria miniovina]|uniref:Uncharacterized protein n=1 Tax=Lasiosphaeria miniovina TaxID=1954250 RepID=A0AA40DS93_9PEZI|nr:uncharacterized protein B0T26DRAFT_367712 [Lasiosphaeria miniovina]KAK0713645.1 hypothetical protein B0T26DRAFT_367712 [Lasiosphaeria miniovina]